MWTKTNHPLSPHIHVFSRGRARASSVASAISGGASSTLRCVQHKQHQKKTPTAQQQQKSSNTNTLTTSHSTSFASFLHIPRMPTLRSVTSTTLAVVEPAAAATPGADQIPRAEIEVQTSYQFIISFTAHEGWRRRWCNDGAAVDVWMCSV